MYNPTFVWFCLIFFFLLLEMGHPGLLYFISFSVGSCTALIAAWYGLNISYQLLACTVGTYSSLLILNRIIQYKEKKGSYRSNIHSLIGQKVLIYQSESDSQQFQAKISGQIWLVRSVHDKPLFSGQHAVIVDVKGCHLQVDAID